MATHVCVFKLNCVVVMTCAGSLMCSDWVTILEYNVEWRRMEMQNVLKRI